MDFVPRQLSNPKIQNKLLNTQELRFEKAYRVTKPTEMAKRNTQEFHTTSSESNQVNKLTEHISKNTEQSVHVIGVEVIIQVSLVNLGRQNATNVPRLVI